MTFQNFGDNQAKTATHTVSSQKIFSHSYLLHQSQFKISITFQALKVCSWNVAGLRALLRNHPDTLENLVKDHAIDILCLQETKLQDIHLEDTKLQIRDTLLQPGYNAYYSCSKTKKGYSGTAVFIRRHDSKATKVVNTLDKFFATSKKGEIKDGPKSEPLTPDIIAKLTPRNISYTMGVDSHDQEGRMIIVDFQEFSLINCYVPNAGQKLERLKYRTQEWDKDFLNFVISKEKPTIWLGDLNVAHTNLEVWNDGAKHLATQAGVTKEERESFQHQLDSSGFIDAFRRLHPTAEGCYTYWSQRAGNRLPNKGLRLDYFCCAPSFFDEKSPVVARDSYMLYDVYGSDHCPIMLELEIKA
jgi:exodeoxyribonuclease III